MLYWHALCPGRPLHGPRYAPNMWIYNAPTHTICFVGVNMLCIVTLMCNDRNNACLGCDGLFQTRHFAVVVFCKEPPSWTTPFQHSDYCVKMKAHRAIGGSFACHREKSYPPFASPHLQCPTRILQLFFREILVIFLWGLQQNLRFALCNLKTLQFLGFCLFGGPLNWVLFHLQFELFGLQLSFYSLQSLAVVSRT